MDTGCENARRLIAERTERDLLRSEEQEVSVHLDQCADCRRFMRTHDEVLGLYIEHFSRQPETLVSPDFTDRVLARLPNLAPATPRLEPTEKVETTKRIVEIAEARPAAPSAPLPPSPKSHPKRKRRGVLRPLFNPPVLAAASVLIIAVLGWLLLIDKSVARLDGWSNSVAWRADVSTDWHPVTEDRDLRRGDAVYVFPRNYARIELADGTEIHLTGDSWIEPLAAGPRITTGGALIRTKQRGPLTVQTPFATIRLEADGESFVQVNRPDERAETAAPAATGSGEVIVWSLRGDSLVTRGDQTTRVGTGEARTFIPGATSAYALTRYEIDVFGRVLEALNLPLERTGWRPPPGMPLAAGLLKTVESDDGAGRVLAVQAAGRLGLRPVVKRALQAAAEPEAEPALRRAVVRAVIRDRMPDAAKILVAFLDDKDPHVRELAVRGLGRLGEKETVEKLNELVKDDKDARVRLGAANALAELEVPVAEKTRAEIAAESQKEAALAALRRFKREAMNGVPAVIETVARYATDLGQDARVRDAAYGLISSAKVAWAEPYLIRALDDPDMWIRVHALSNLSSYPFDGKPLDPRTKKRVREIAFNDSTHERERRMAVSVLANRNGAEASEFRTLILSADAGEEVRVEAVRAWSKMGPHDAAEFERLFEKVDSESRPSAKILDALVRLYGSDSVGASKSWIFNLLADKRSIIARAAVVALGELIDQRGLQLTNSDVNILKLRLNNVRQGSGWSPLVRRIVEATRNDDEKLAFLTQLLEEAQISVQKRTVIHTIAGTKSGKAIPILLRLLGDEDPRVVTAAAGGLARFGVLAGSAVPEVRRRLIEWLDTDPLASKPDTYNLAWMLLRLGDVSTALPVLTGVIDRDQPEALDAVAQIYKALGSEAAAPILLRFKGHANPKIRRSIARYYSRGVPVALHGEILNWWRVETDPWTRFGLAFTVLETDRGPAQEALKWLGESAQDYVRVRVAKRIGVSRFEDVVALVNDTTRRLPSGFREAMFEFIDQTAFSSYTLYLPGERRSVEDAKTGATRGPTTVEEIAQIGTYGRTWLERVRYVRQGLCTHQPEIRKAAAVNARAVLDPMLVPPLIDALGDPKSLEVRKAAADTLSRIDREALAGYRPEAEGEALLKSVDAVRRAFHRINLEKKIPRPGPLELSNR